MPDLKMPNVKCPTTPTVLTLSDKGIFIPLRLTNKREEIGCVICWLDIKGNPTDFSSINQSIWIALIQALADCMVINAEPNAVKGQSDFIVKVSGIREHIHEAHMKIFPCVNILDLCIGNKSMFLSHEFKMSNIYVVSVGVLFHH